ncbi:MAG: nitrate reductase molybdenum cofactor assembly chaperone [Actinobacteria bacterium]|nr:nitrate reductase molybdenum cofactor assembly chaperone [Actinomycetota bacterium]
MTTATARLVASSLLIYPDENFMQKLSELEKSISGLAPHHRSPFDNFLVAIKEMTLDEIQRHYVEIFDMRRRCSLFLTSWTHGDTRNRGMALIYFKEKYKDANIDISDEELPDHLAVVLEFAALVDPVEGSLLLGEHRAPIELIRDALHSANSFYAYVLDAVVATLPPMTAEIAERAKALALSGPPQEFVGLSGAVTIAIQPFSATSSLVADGVRI